MIRNKIFDRRVTQHQCDLLSCNSVMVIVIRCSLLVYLWNKSEGFCINWQIQTLLANFAHSNDIYSYQLQHATNCAQQLWYVLLISNWQSLDNKNCTKSDDDTRREATNTGGRRNTRWWMSQKKLRITGVLSVTHVGIDWTRCCNTSDVTRVALLYSWSLSWHTQHIITTAIVCIIRH